MLPGYSFDCPYGEFTYDPRVRPWYVGASSGPKDVIIVLDTSGSMNSLGRMVSYLCQMYFNAQYHQNKHEIFLNEIFVPMYGRI